MSEIELYPRNQEIIAQRAETLCRILSGEEPARIDDVIISFKGPEYGWLEIQFEVEGKRPFLIEASDVYPPFPDFKDWLEHMMDFTNFPSESFSIDSEGYNTILSYDYLGHIEKDEICEPVALIQMADTLVGEDRTATYEPVYQLIVPIREFVSDLYLHLKNYMFDNRRIFSKHWHHPGGGDFDIRKLMRSFVSKKVEQEIERMNEYTGDLGHWPYIRIR